MLSSTLKYDAIGSPNMSCNMLAFHSAPFLSHQLLIPIVDSLTSYKSSLLLFQIIENIPKIFMKNEDLCLPVIL